MPLIHHEAEIVPNKVLWLNPNFQPRKRSVRKLRQHEEGGPKVGGKKLSPIGPLNLIRGKNTPLGLFSISTSTGLKFVTPQTSTGFSRNSSLEEKISLRDSKGNLYQRLNFKGIGLIGAFKILDYTSGRIQDTDSRAGTADPKMAKYYRKATLLLDSKGIRITPDVAHIRLEKYPSSRIPGYKTLYDKFNKSGEGLLVLRAFGCLGRVENANDRQLVFDAIEAVKKELGLKNMTKQEYLDWFTKTLAENLAKMHSNELTHEALTEHNITLDARITDLGSVIGKGLKKHASNIKLAKACIENLNEATHMTFHVANALYPQEYTRDPKTRFMDATKAKNRELEQTFHRTYYKNLKLNLRDKQS